MCLEKLIQSQFYPDDLALKWNQSYKKVQYKEATSSVGPYYCGGSYPTEGDCRGFPAESRRYLLQNASRYQVHLRMVLAEESLHL